MTTPGLRRLTAAAMLVALCAGASALSTTACAQGGQPGARELMQLNQDLQDPAKAFDAVQRARSYLLVAKDSSLHVFLHRGIVTGLIVGNAPGRMVLGAADSALRTFAKEPLQQVVIHGELAQYLVNHGDMPERALRHARLAAHGVPPDPRFDAFRGMAFGTLGEAYLLSNKPDSAVISLRRALAMSPDTQRVLRQLGSAYERQKKDDLAIDAYTRSLAVYLADDTSAMVPLRALWTKSGKPLATLDERIGKARAASRQAIALDARKFERVAPGWTLPDLEGKSLKLADHAGKVVVLDFWGTWCGPCREELPIFQKMYERYRHKDVVFYGVNWERVGPGQDAKPLVRDYMTKHSLTFPVVLDHERTAQTAYDIEAFPTVFLIDKAGKIRYRNVGVTPGIEQILADQIESLLE